MGFKTDWKKRAWKMRILQAFLEKYDLPLSFFSQDKIEWMFASQYDDGFRDYLKCVERGLDLPVGVRLADKFRTLAKV